MNYYKRHIGDYLKDTAHLSLLEHGVYARLLDVYYTRETAIPDDQAARLIGARSKEELSALRAVLGEFFALEDGAWTQQRCEREIGLKEEKSETNRVNGKRGGRPKKETQSVSEKNPNGFEIETQTEPTENPSHKPLANSQEVLAPTVLVSADAPTSSADRLACPYAKLGEAWNSTCTSLPAVRAVSEWHADRKTACRLRWQEKLALGKYQSEEQGVEYWRRLFAFIEASDFLAGRSKDWTANFDWVLKPKNLTKIIEGQYVNKAEAVPA
ncbi:YdaU family protein [Casimicrobium huifangae]|uniref:YdaU family protein n=1 Tax=Casimicrobium huifangae TaxID=2591109 RepID=UPI0037848FA9